MRCNRAVSLGLGIGMLVCLAGVVGAGTKPQAAAALGDERPLRAFIGRHIGRLADLRAELSLTPEQRSQIREIVAVRRKELGAAVKQVVTQRRALRDAVLAEAASEEAIRSAAAELGEAMGDAAVLASRIVSDVRPVLTPEQIERLRQFRQESADATDAFLQGIMQD